MTDQVYAYARVPGHASFQRSHLARSREDERTLCGRKVETVGQDVTASVEDLIRSRFMCGNCKRSLQREHRYSHAVLAKEGS